MKVIGRESADNSKSHSGRCWEKLLNYTEMMTVLTDIEAIINSRPLTYVSDDIRDGGIITSALLAVGRDFWEIHLMHH